MLRCNRCERPICTECAVLTPTGYRCKECVRGQQKVFDTAKWFDYPLAIIVGGRPFLSGQHVRPVFGLLYHFYCPGRWGDRSPKPSAGRSAGGVRALLFQLATLGAVLGALLPLLLLTCLLRYARIRWI